jgi:hypothetical protein
MVTSVFPVCECSHDVLDWGEVDGSGGRELQAPGEATRGSEHARARECKRQGSFHVGLGASSPARRSDAAQVHAGEAVVHHELQQVAYMRLVRLQSDAGYDRA